MLYDSSFKYINDVPNLWGKKNENQLKTKGNEQKWIRKEEIIWQIHYLYV